MKNKVKLYCLLTVMSICICGCEKNTDDGENATTIIQDITSNTEQEVKKTVKVATKYSSDGELIERTTYNYDESGKLIKETFDSYKPGMQLASGETVIEKEYYTNITEYEYNENDLLEREIFYKLGNTNKLYVTYTYDEEGRLIEKVDENNQKFTYVYDEEGRILEETGFWEYGFAYNYAYVYDEEGRVIEETNIEERGVEYVYYEYYKYIYDEEGRIIEEAIFEGDYNEYCEYIDNDKGGRKVEYKYDEDGNVISIERYNAESELSSARYYEYNEFGDLTAETVTSFNYDFSEEGVYEYINTYSETGQLLSVIEVKDNLEIRKVEYNEDGNIIYEYAEGSYEREYDNEGNILKDFNGEGIGVEYEYDEEGYLVKFTEYYAITPEDTTWDGTIGYQYTIYEY